MHLVFLTPSPDPAGGGSAFNAGLIPALRSLGHDVAIAHGMDGLPDSALPVVDGLLLPDLAPHIERLVARDAIAVVHHVSAKAGRNEAARDAVRAAEHAMLPRLRRVVATSATVGERLTSEFGIEAPLLLQPGMPDLPRSTGSAGGACHVLSVGVMTPRKGHDRLLRGLARLFDLDWTLTIAGDAQRDRSHAASIAGLVDELALQSRVTILPDPTMAALEPVWQSADLFALASSWEGHPAGLAEALRRGLPFVATNVGGVGALLPATAGLLCAPDDAATFSKCLRRAIFDTGLRASLADAAWEAGCALPGWAQQARAFETIVKD